jgi:hypothetical protein
LRDALPLLILLVPFLLLPQPLSLVGWVLLLLLGLLCCDALLLLHVSQLFRLVGARLLCRGALPVLLFLLLPLVLLLSLEGGLDLSLPVGLELLVIDWRLLHMGWHLVSSRGLDHHLLRPSPILRSHHHCAHPHSHNYPHQPPSPSTCTWHVRRRGLAYGHVQVRQTQRIGVFDRDCRLLLHCTYESDADRPSTKAPRCPSPQPLPPSLKKRR